MKAKKTSKKSKDNEAGSKRDVRAQKQKPTVLTPRVLRAWRLPQPDGGGDKEERGRVLIVGGAPQMPGAIVLAATAALRAGAGKLQIATTAKTAGLVAMSVPEAYVVALPEKKSGALALSGVDLIAEHANKVQAVLIGPGMVDEESVVNLIKSLLPNLEKPVVVLDAAPLACFTDNRQILQTTKCLCIVTPHAGEMASMLKIDKQEVEADALAVARRAAEELRAVVALKGSETFIVAPDGVAYHKRTGNIGLATSGSGDTLSGIIAGLAARGAEPLQAAAWGVFLHARAGDELAKRMGRLGFLARELLAEIPRVMAHFD